LRVVGKRRDTLTTQILGTQIFGPKYHFTEESPVLEGAKRIREMGSNLIKFRFKDLDEFHQIVDLGFDHILFWFQHLKFDTAIDETKVYQQTLELALHLLQHYQGTNKTFYIGHWEGDWLLNPPEQAALDAPDDRIQLMIRFINARQKAIEFAKYAYPNASVFLYHYVEVNRVVDALDLGLRRYVNAVLPFVNPDLVSYSAYDCQRKSKLEIHRLLDYVESQLTPKSSLPFQRRVFIGEFGIPAAQVAFDQERHLRENLAIIEKFASWGCPFVLYWEMYNNEIAKDGSQIGYWLIDEHNQSWPLHDFYRNYYRLSQPYSRPQDVLLTLQTMIQGALNP
jgi:hypothetical protein